MHLIEAVFVYYEVVDDRIDEDMLALNQNGVLVSVFIWDEKKNNGSVGCFTRLMDLLNTRRDHTAILFMDAESSNAFISQANKVREALMNPCYCHWVFFDFHGIATDMLSYKNVSTVCWRSIILKHKQEQVRNTNETKLMIIGPSMDDEGGCAMIRRMGQWSSVKGLRGIHRRKRPIQNFRNRTLKVSFVDEQPYRALKKDGSGYEGIEHELIGVLERKLNFQVMPVEREDEDFGKRDGNGSWTGFMGLVTDGKVIFSLSTLTITNERIKSVDFTFPYMCDELRFIVISPALLSRKYVLFRPLSIPVWLGLVLTFCMGTFVLYLLTHLLRYKSSIRNTYNVWFLLRTLSQQSTPISAPPRYSLRFFIASWWMYIMVITWGYGGTLTSFMTAPGRRPAVDTIPELQRALNKRSIRYGTLGGTAYEDFLMVNMAKVDPIFANSLLENPDDLVHKVQEGMIKVLEEKYAFMYMKLALDWHMSATGEDQYRLSKDVFSMEYVAMAIEKCHPCKESIDHIIVRLEETGFMAKWNADAMEKARIYAPPSHIRHVRPLSMDDLQGAFYLLGYGLGASGAVFILEMILPCVVFCAQYYHRRGKRKKTKKVHFKEQLVKPARKVAH